MTLFQTERPCYIKMGWIHFQDQQFWMLHLAAMKASAPKERTDNADSNYLHRPSTSNIHEITDGRMYRYSPVDIMDDHQALLYVQLLVFDCTVGCLLTEGA